MWKQVSLLVVAVAMAAQPGTAQAPDLEAATRTAAKRIDEPKSITAAEHECVRNTIACNQSRTGEVTASDCRTDDFGTYFDIWFIQLSAGQSVTLDLASSTLDPFLLALDPDGNRVGHDDDGGTGLNARFAFTAGRSGEYVVSTSGTPGAAQLGSYQFSATCGAGSSAPAAPTNLQAVGTSSSQIAINWNDNSNDESEFVIERRQGGGAFGQVGTAPANTGGAVVSGMSPSTAYTFRVRARNASGSSGFSNEATASTLAGGGSGGPCLAGAGTLCLAGGRFKVTATFATPQGQQGAAMVVPLTDETGYFWFFSESNVEAVIKVLNGCPVNSRFWVFAGGLTNVQVSLTVTDTDTGATKTYTNPQGTPFAPIQDTAAFATCN